MDGLRSVFRRLRAFFTNPTVLAVLLAAIAWPIVALSLDATAGGDSSRPLPRLPYDDLGRWAGAGGAVFAAALVAGTLGAKILRRNVRLGGIFTVVIAWAVGVATTPILPALLGRKVGFAIVCMDPFGCHASLEPGIPERGYQAVLWSPLGPLIEVVPFVTLVIGVTIWVVVLRLGSARTLRS